MELGEHLYNGDLKLNDVTDPFQRPARQWEFDGKEIGTYIKEELMDFEKVGEVTGKDLYEVLGKTAIDEYTMIVALDGVTDPAIVRESRKANGFKEYDGDTKLGSKHNQDFVFDAADLNRSNKGSVGATGTGVLTQVFVDPNYDNGGSAKDGRIWISVINTYLARATQDYDSRREELPLNAYSVDKYRGEFVALPQDGTVPETVRLGVEEYPVVKDAKKDDSFLVTFAEGEVQTIVPAEIMSAVTVSSFKKDSNVVVDGTKYNFTTTAGFDAKTLKTYTGGSQVNLKDTTYNVFLDAYGNTIGVQEVDAKKNYVFLAAIDINDSNLINGTADAKAVFLDGTVDTIRVNLDKSDLDWYGDLATPGGYNKNSILNTWCTYTKNNSNVYTVKQVVDINVKGDTFVPGYKVGNKVNNDTGLAQYHQTGFTSANEKIDKKHITLQGNKANSGDYARVYGNKDTVYLNTELTNLSNQGGVWGVIKDVDSVTTGAENVNLTVWTDQKAQEAAETKDVKLKGNDYATKGVYTLYNDDGIVIAAVVAGEDDGSAKNLVYVHSGSIDSETYNGDSASRAAGDGLWTWTRKVIKDGQEVTLTEVSDGNSELDMMLQYHWYQIKTNGDGEVTGVYELPDDNSTKLKEANLTHYKDYALDYKPYTYTEDGVKKSLGEIAYTVQKGSSTVLYWNQDYINSHPYMNGRTLYVATDDQTGFIVNSNVKWVVQQWDNNKKETYIDDGTTASGLKNMIDEINRRHTVNGAIINYPYQVSAVIESGVASSVVIHFNENDYNRPDRPITGNTTLKWDRFDEIWDLTVPVDEDKVNNLTTTQIRNYLIDAGCSNIVKTRDGWTFTIDGTQYENQIVKVWGQKAPAAYDITKGTETNGTFSVAASAKAGATVTVTTKPNDGYEVGEITVTYADKTVKDITASKSFTMPAQSVTVDVTFTKIVTPVKGIKFEGGSAVKDTDFEVAEKDGVYTITAVDTTLGVKVYADAGCGYTAVKAGSDESVWTVTPDEANTEITVKINKYEWQVVKGDDGSFGIAAKEVMPKTLSRARTMAGTATISSKSAADGFMKISFDGIDGLKEAYVVKLEARTVGGVSTTAYWFGKDNSEAELNTLVNKLNAAKGDFTVKADPTVTDEEKDAWKGESTNPPAEDAKLETPVYKDGKYIVNYYGEDELDADAIKAALAEKFGGTAALDEDSGKFTVTKPDGTKVNGTVDVENQNRYCKVYYQGAVLQYVPKSAGPAKVTLEKKFDKNAVLLLTKNEDVYASTSMNGEAMINANGVISVTTTMAEDRYLYDAVLVNYTGLSTAKVVAKGEVTDDTVTTGDAVRVGTVLSLTGSGDGGYRELQLDTAAKGKPAFDTYEVKERYTNVKKTTAYTYKDLTITKDMVGSDGKTVKLQEVEELYKVTLGSQTKYEEKNHEVSFSITEGDAYIVGMTGDAVGTGRATLKYAVDEAHDPLDAANGTDRDYAITLVRGYQLTVGDDVAVNELGNVEVTVAKKADGTPIAFTNGEYIAKGMYVTVVAADASKALVSKDSSVELKLKTGSRDTYTFQMPDKDVADTVITAGTVSIDVSPRSFTAAGDPDVANGTAHITVEGAINNDINLTYW